MLIDLLPSEPKQVVMLIILLAIALFGNGFLIYYLATLDREEPSESEEEQPVSGDLHG